ncbi:MAG TPA: xanthine dehydrogenase family protein molybdopterin-binding subunit, partial [Acidimicrobiia bacterium]|nr:xanthine dehydrogenase family protein molybdopterin-binding subunit [Acidimicrobiia bacterium]
MAVKGLVGASLPRVEDERLLAGRGRYVDDVTVPAMLHAAFLRSPWPHAVIRSIDTEAAASQPGVVAVFTGEDIRHLTHPFFGTLALPGLYGPPYWALATDRVRMVGDPVALVVAESRRLAEDACELIDVDYDPLEPVATMEHALDPAKPALWPRAKGNVLCQETRRFGDVDAAFAGADRIISERFAQHRQSNQPMETRGSVAEVDRVTGDLTLHTSNQALHLAKWCLALLLQRRPVRESLSGMARQRRALRRFATGARAYLKANPAIVAGVRGSLPTMGRQFLQDPSRSGHLLRALVALLGKDAAHLPEVRAGDVGGAFGAKYTISREDVALCAAALQLGRSVKWIEDRNEHLLVGGQAREEAFDVEAAVRRDGTLLGLRIRMTLDSGAYQQFPFGADIACRLISTMLPGPYKVAALEFTTTMVATNKGQYVFYRGPWAAESFVRERMLDVIARELGLSRAEVRLRNMYGEEELPARMVTGPTLDVRMSAKATLQRALERAAFDGWEEAQARARADGRHLGLGFATYIEAAPGPPGYYDHVVFPGFSAITPGIEPVHAVLEADGTVTLVTQQQPHGQGHETTLAQLAADELGVPVAQIRVRFGSTSASPFGFGTGGSKSAAVTGGATGLAAKELRGRIVDVAADLLEAAPADVVVEDGLVHVRGVPAVHVTLADVAAEAIRRAPVSSSNGHQPGEAIRVTGAWNGGDGGWAQATHVCWAEVDLDTGVVSIPRYLVVEDCGEIINPAIVAGQIRGGV